MANTTINRCGNAKAFMQWDELCGAMGFCLFFVCVCVLVAGYALETMGVERVSVGGNGDTTSQVCMNVMLSGVCLFLTFFVLSGDE